ncbi:hypothetical protein K466DRAFT_595175 [Polyporus arcularius HHB13444]|uniref:F-box domain-containing protein n=1 Tax=Polyporus arcularius HHB13444 TaxID=1314778 RepID=A0A5C3PSY3_9APHY|nr:hypothetical protein K466DRAFT_595175 [Polyporus arcularius HHB13444]
MFSVSAFPRLPVEIFERILKALESDERSLSACAQVTRRWREVSSVFRFQTVSLYTRSQFESFCEWSRMPSTQELARHIKVLKLIGEPRGFVLDCQLFASIFPNLPGLDEVYTQDICILPPSISQKDERIWPIVSLTQRITRRLPLPFLSPTRILRALLTNVAPQTLVLDIPIYQEIFLPQTVLPSWKISRLLLTERTNFQTIASSGVLAPNTLEHVALSWSVWDHQSLDELLHFTRTLGQNVSSMDLQLDLSYLCLRCLRRFGEALALLQSLRELRLQLRIPSQGIDPSHSALKDIYSEAPRTLTSFTVRFEGPDTAGDDSSSLQWLDLHELDRPWFRERFPKLQSVTVELESADLHTRSAVVMSLLPKLHQAQLLRIIEVQ